MAEAISATKTAHQIPSIPKKTGSTNTEISSKTNDLTNEIIAEMVPLLRAVKNAEARIFPPDSKNAIRKILNACTVSERRSAS